MSNDKEKISAYIDDGLSPEELKAIKSIESESEFSIALRYQMMGEALRGQLGDAAMVDVSAQVRETLRSEDIKVADQLSRPVIKRQDKQAGRPMFDFSAWFRPLWGLAVAASVALVMVVAVTQVETPSGDASLIADTSTANVPGVNNPGLAAVSVPVAVAVEETATRELQAVNLDAYLAEHAEFAAQDTLQGRMPYARAVSYESR